MRRSDKLHADEAYASRRNRHLLRRRITPRVARQKVDSIERLGRHRWVAERTFGWLYRNCRRLMRYERRPELHDAFMSLGCALMCWRFLARDGL